jgi:adenylate cyclase
LKPKLFKIGDQLVRPQEGEISSSVGLRHVHPKVMEVLVCLTNKQGEVVTRDEILNEVWGHQHGTDKALTRCISELRRALGDDGKDSRFIRTIPKRGYRLLVAVEPVSNFDTRPEKSQTQKNIPSIAVLPFINMSGEPDQEYFSDGITEDIITELCKFSGLFVIARNSSFTFKNKQVSVKQISQELGARYILEGSVRKVDNRIRVTAKLADGIDGGHVWAERFDRELKDIFAVQDEVVNQIVKVLAVKLTANQELVFKRHTQNMEAYEYVLRGRELAWLHQQETGAEARRLLSQAIWLDPNYTTAYSWLAFAHVIDYINQWGEDPDQSLSAGAELAKKAVKLDDTDAQAHFVLGEYCLWINREHAVAMDEAKRAIDLEPNYSHAYLLLGHALHYAGRSDESLEHFGTAMRLDPFYPDLYLHFLAQSYYHLGQFQNAIDVLKERLQRNSSTDISQVLLAACYGQLGRRDEAIASWERAHNINKNYSLEIKRRILPYKNSADFEFFVDGLRKAGIAT